MKHLFIAALLLASAAFAQEDKLLAVLKSDAPQKEKMDACRELARVATKQAVPTLAGLLSDEKLSHMARYALEPIADPSVEAALRDALGKLKGRLLTGVIGSLGVRKDKQAIEPIAKFLTDADPMVAQAAARALGSIGGAPAVNALEGVLATATPANQLAVCEGLFRCAEALPGADATAIYDKVRTVPNAAHQVRVAALRGAILSRGAAGVPMLVEAIRTESYVPMADAMRITMDMPGAEVTKAMAGELAQANPDKQQLLAQTLGYRGDATAAPALVPLAQTGSAPVRLAALRSLVQLGNPVAVPVLVAAVSDANKDIATAAQNGLAGFASKDADDAIVKLLDQPAPQARVAAMDIVGQRRVTAAAPALLKATEDADATVANASFKALGELAGVAEIPAVVNALLKTKSTGAAENALSAICGRQPDPTVCADKLLPGLAQAQGESKLALLRVLRSAGGPQALAAVRTATTDANAALKETAVRTLCYWPTPDALPDVMQLAKNTTDAKCKILALRGQLRLIPQQKVSDAQKLAALKDAMAMIERNEEKRLALAALGEIPTAESLALVVPYLTTPGLKEEANVAAVAIAEKIVDKNPAEVAAAMKQVQTNNKKLAQRAKQLQGQAKKK